MATPVVRCTESASSRCTCTGTSTCSEQLAEPFDGVAHHGAADVVGVVVGHQHAGQAQAVAGQHVEQIADPVGGVDHHRLPGLPVTDEVGEVDHLAGEGSPTAKSRPESSWRK